MAKQVGLHEKIKNKKNAVKSPQKEKIEHD